MVLSKNSFYTIEGSIKRLKADDFKSDKVIKEWRLALSYSNMVFLRWSFCMYIPILKHQLTNEKFKQRFYTEIMHEIQWKHKIIITVHNHIVFFPTNHITTHLFHRFTFDTSQSIRSTVPHHQQIILKNIQFPNCSNSKPQLPILTYYTTRNNNEIVRTIFVFDWSA